MNVEDLYNSVLHERALKAARDKRDESREARLRSSACVSIDNFLELLVLPTVDNCHSFTNAVPYRSLECVRGREMPLLLCNFLA